MLVFANYSYFRLGRVSKSTFRIILEIYIVIFKDDKGIALVELFLYNITNTIFPPGYHHNDFVVTQALGHMMNGSYVQVH